MAVTLSHFRFGKNELAESTHGWHANEDTNPAATVIPLDTTFLLRFTSQCDGTQQLNVDCEFQYQKNGGTWTNITTSSTNVRAVAATPLTNGGDCTKRLSGTGTFVTNNDGQTTDGTSGGNNNDITANGNSETECGLTLRSADLAAGDTLNFRLTRDTGNLYDTYAVTPQLKIPAYLVSAVTATTAVVGALTTSITLASATTATTSATADLTAGLKPTFIASASTLVGASSWGTNQSINLPGSITAGDLLIAFVSMDGQFASNTLAISGWALEVNHINHSTPDSQTVWVLYKIATGSEGATATVTGGPSSNGASLVRVLQYRYGDGVTALDATTVTTNNTSTNASPVSVSLTGITTATDNATVVALLAMDWTASTTGAATLTSWASGFVEQLDVNDNNWNHIGVADKTLGTHGASGAITATATLASTNAGYLGVVLALKPSAGSTGNISAASTATTSASGDLTTSITAASAVTATSAVVGALTTSIRCASDVTATTAVVGALTTSITAASAATATAAVTGALTTQITMAADTAATTSSSATLTSQPALLVSDVTTVTSATGGLTTQITAAAAVTAATSSTADLTTSIRLASDTTATTSSTGALTTSITCTSATTATTAATAALTTSITCAAAATASTSATAGLTTAIQMVSAATAATSSVGALTTAIQLASAPASVAAALGDLTTSIRCVGASVITSVSTGDLTTVIALAGDALSTTSASGALANPSLDIAADSVAQTSATGDLSTAITMAAGAFATVTTAAALKTWAPVAPGTSVVAIKDLYFENGNLMANAQNMAGVDRHVQLFVKMPNGKTVLFVRNQ